MNGIRRVFVRWLAPLFGGATMLMAGEGLPLVEYAVPDPVDARAPLVVLVSGDGGWAEIDRELAQRWRNRGWPVVGLNALKYFWQKRTPAAFAETINDLVTTYRARWGARPVVLAGFSFGADTVPFAYNRLPANTRSTVMAMVLLSPAEASMWEAGMASWWGGSSAGPKIAPEVAAIAPLPVLIITGEADPDAFDDWVERPCLEHEKWPGDHHLDRRYDRIDTTVAAFWARIGSSPTDLPEAR